MNKKMVYLGLVVGLVTIVLAGSLFSSDSTEVATEDYDSAYYVENNRNLIIKTAKVLDKCCFYLVDVVVSSVGSVFSTVVGS